MAGIPPFFITGASAKIKLNGVTLAFCTDLSYSITVAHATPTVLGMYEAASIEPLSYKVSGALSVVRYANRVKEELEKLGYKTPNGVSPDGNGVGNWTPNNGSGLSDVVKRLGAFGNDGRAHESFDPSKLENATFFDIEVYQKMPNGAELRGVAKIRNCRLVKADLIMSKKQPTMERFQFQAIYVDEDSFNADFSGDGQAFD